MLVYEREVSLAAPAYFVAMEFEDDQVSSVRDFLCARCALAGITVPAVDRP